MWLIMKKRGGGGGWDDENENRVIENIKRKRVPYLE
jgi:hypothetical protein